MTSSTVRWLLTAAGAAFAATALPAMAAQTWNFANTPNATCSRNEGLGNTVVCSGAVTATLSGWGTTADTASSTFASAYINNQGDNGIGLQSRLGSSTSTTLETSNSPEHAVDSTQNSEVIAFAFSKAVSLTSVTFGYADLDADFSLLAWADPTTAPSTATKIGGQTASTLIGAGWKLVGTYSAAGNAADATIDVTTNVSNSYSSSYWLIGAFNATIGGSLGKDATADAWKLLSVAGTTASALPEPGSLALVGVAMLGALASRRGKAVTA